MWWMDGSKVACIPFGVCCVHVSYHHVFWGGVYSVHCTKPSTSDNDLHRVRRGLETSEPNASGGVTKLYVRMGRVWHGENRGVWAVCGMARTEAAVEE